MATYFGILDGDRDNGYGIVFPDLPGCTAMGDSIDEARRNATEAVADWADVTEANGGTIPKPRALEELRADREAIEALRQGGSVVAIPLVRDSGRKTVANLSLDTGLLAAIDATAKARKISRSSLVELLARRGLAELA